MPTDVAISLKEILDKLQNYQLPTLSSPEGVKAKLALSDIATGDILPMVQDDPVFCLYAQKAAGEKQKGRGGEVKGVEHALSVLGIDDARVLVAKLTSLEKLKTPQFIQSTSESMLAAYIVSELLRQKAMQVQEARSVAMYCRAAEWMMDWLKPSLSLNLKRQNFLHPFQQSLVSKSIYGFSLIELQRALIMEFSLPVLNGRVARFSPVTILRELLQVVSLHRKDNLRLEECSRELRLHLGAPEMLPLIVNKLAQSSCYPWLVNAWGRWVNLAAIHCHLTEREVENAVIAGCHLAFKRELSFPLWAAGSALVMEKSSAPYKRDKHVKPEKTAPEKSKESVAALGRHYARVPKVIDYSTEQKQVIKSLYRKLVDTPEKFENIKMVVSECLKTLSESTPLERVSFLGFNSEKLLCKSMLSTVKGKKESAPVILADFKQCPVFQKFLPKQTFLLFDKERHQRFWSQLPSAVCQDPRVLFFLFNSLSYHQKVRSFLYADMALSGYRLPDDFLKDFKHIAAGMASALRYHSKA